MTKADLVEIIFEQVGLPKKEAQTVVESIFDTIMQAFKDGEGVKLSGFGAFSVRQKRSRRGRNPKTGDEIEITPRRVLTFRVSNQLRDSIEKRGRHSSSPL